MNPGECAEFPVKITKNGGGIPGEAIYNGAYPMAAEESPNFDSPNLHRPGAVPGPPAMPSLVRPGALATPMMTGVAPVRPASREILSVDPEEPLTSRFRPQPASEPGAALDAKPGIQPVGTRLIAPPWKAAEEEAPVPRSVVERAQPREAGVRVNQMNEGAWPWTRPGLDTAAQVDEPWQAAAHQQEAEDRAVDRRPRRSFPWKAWALFALAWVGLFWLVLEREERLDAARAQAESRARDGSYRATSDLPSHIGVENPREVEVSAPAR